MFLAFLVCLVLIPAGRLHAQSAQLTVDPSTSLAWWQINPHLGHLWATTCPEDPTWQAGSGSAYKSSDVDAGKKPPPVSMYMETKIPLYPRLEVSPVCTQAVRGQVQADDLRSGKGVRGLIAIRSNALRMALEMRNRFTHAVMETDRYPEIRFRIDSLTAVQPGDTLRANAVGILYLHGVQQPMSIPLKAWEESGGLRVTGAAQIDAVDLVETYHMSKWKPGLGIGTNIWKHLHMGLDVILRADRVPGASGQ